MTLLHESLNHWTEVKGAKSQQDKLGFHIIEWYKIENQKVGFHLQNNENFLLHRDYSSGGLNEIWKM